MYSEIKRILDHYKTLQYVSETFDMGNQVIEHFKKQAKLIKINKMEDLDINKPFLISSVEFWKFEGNEKINAYKTRLQYTYPVVMLLPDDFSLELDDILKS